MDFDIERIKAAIPLETYIQGLKKEGRLFVKCCEFHSEKHASMKIDPEKQIVTCYGSCAWSGDIFAYVMRRDNRTFPEAKEELARYAGIILTPLSPEKKAQDARRERIAAVLEASAQAYHEALYSPFGMFALGYLKDKRGLSDETIKAARLGYSPMGGTAKGFTDDELVDAGIMRREKDSGIPYSVFRERIMIPVHDAKGHVIGLIGRATMDNQDIKYLYNAGFEKSSHLHRMPRHDTTRGVDSVVCVEGSIDPLSAANRGVYNVVSLMGSSLSETQLNLLAKIASKIIFCFDNDTAGKTATERLGSHLQAAARLGVELYVMHAPHGKDPDDTFREHPELWQGAVDAARPVVDVLIEMSIGALPQNPSAHDKSPEIKRLLKLFTVENPLITRENREKLATGFKVRDDDLEKIAQMGALTPLPRNTYVKPTQIQQAYPPFELVALNGILINDHQRWLERANAALSLAGPYKKALCPLSLNDFTHEQTRSLMSMIAWRVEANERPIDGYIEAELRGGVLEEIYARATSNPDVQAIFASAVSASAFVLSYETFIRAVYTLRRNRLERDLAQGIIPQEDILEWQMARRALSISKMRV